MFHRFNERARDAIDRATKKAKELRHALVEPEHILASLADAPSEGRGETSFHSLLKTFQVERRAVADSLEAVPGPPGASAEPVFSPEAKRILEFAVEEAERLGHKRIGTSHFLIAFLRDEIESGRGARTLSDLGLQIEDVRSRVRELADGEASGPQDVVPSILFFELDRRARDAERGLGERIERLERGEKGGAAGELERALAARVERLEAEVREMRGLLGLRKPARGT